MKVLLIFYSIFIGYLLSRKEGRFGTPEKPLSELGRLCYSSYWETVVLQHLNRIDREKKITIKSNAALLIYIYSLLFLIL